MKNVRNWYESHGLKQKQQVGFSLRGAATNKNPE